MKKENQRLLNQAIITKYIAPTNTRGARIKAYCYGGTLTFPWDYALSPEDNHLTAAFALANKLNWGVGINKFISGILPDQTYCHLVK